jgi:hypothetical protein
MQNHTFSEPVLIFTKKQKNFRTAFLLTFLFGPIGLVYASPCMGILMCLLGGVFIQVNTVLPLIIFYWALCIAFSLFIVRYNNLQRSKKVYLKYKFDFPYTFKNEN